MNAQISSDLFNKIRSKFSNITIGDSEGSPTADPKEARFFDFEYMEDADTFGRMSISLAEEQTMKVYYNRGLTEKIDEDSKAEFYAFLQELKQFAVQHQLGFDVRDITKSNLTKQDYKNLADTNQTVNTDEMSEELNRITKLAGVEVKEGLTGTSKSSYENLDKTRLIVRHTGPVDENVPGARTRHINSLYIENEDGERFKYPVIHLAGARAMTRHVANGGRPHDEFGQHIINTSEDIAKLNSFSRYVAHKDQLNDSAGDIIEQTKLKLENLRTYVKSIAKQGHYENAVKDFKQSDEIVLDDETANSYKEKFTLRNLDNRVEEALPLIHKIMSEYKPDDEPTDKDAKIEPPVDHGAIVTSFLTDPDKKLVLRKDDAADKMLSVTKFNDKNTMLGSILSDIASRMLTKDNQDDRVANFASRVADAISQEGQPFFKPDEDHSKNKKIAVQLAKRYIDDYKKMKSDPSYADEVRMEPGAFAPKKDRTGKAKEDSFESWANRVTEGTWSLPNKDEDIEDLEAVMKNQFDVGTDATNATTMLSRLGFGDDSLYDELGDLYDRDGERADARPIVQDYVMQMLVPQGNYSSELSPEIKAKLQKAVSVYKKDDRQKELPGIPAKEPMFAGEEITFEDIKPYVSMYSDKDSGKMTYDVLDKDGESAFKTHDAKLAMKYLSRNFDKLKKDKDQRVESQESLNEQRAKIITAIESRADHEIADIVRLAKS
jgi:hypothetical protein